MHGSISQNVLGDQVSAGGFCVVVQCEILLMRVGKEKMLFGNAIILTD